MQYSVFPLLYLFLLFVLNWILIINSYDNVLKCPQMFFFVKLDN